MNDPMDPVEEEAEKLDEEQVGDEELAEENDSPSPVFYDPQEVLSLNVWLNRAAVAGAVVAAIMSAFTMPNMQNAIRSIFPGILPGSVIANLATIVISLLAAALQGAIIYFPLQALAAILKILMEMEFNSRGVK
jgi:hypothetical protein